MSPLHACRELATALLSPLNAPPCAAFGREHRSHLCQRLPHAEIDLGCQQRLQTVRMLRVPGLGWKMGLLAMLHTSCPAAW